MSDNSSIHGKNNDNDNSSDEGISSSGLFVNQKSLLNNFNLQNKFTFGQQQQDDAEMSENNEDEAGNNGNGNGDLEGDEDNNGYSSQE